MRTMRRTMLGAVLGAMLLTGCAGMNGSQGPAMISVPADSIVFARMPFVVSVFRLRELYVEMRRAPAAKCQTDAQRDKPACVQFRAVDEEAKALWQRLEAKMLAPTPAGTPQQSFDAAQFAEVLGKLIGVAAGIAL